MFPCFKQVTCIASNSDWFIALFAPVTLLGQSNCFGIGFSTGIWKPRYIIDVWIRLFVTELWELWRRSWPRDRDKGLTRSLHPSRKLIGNSLLFPWRLKVNTHSTKKGLEKLKTSLFNCLHVFKVICRIKDESTFFFANHWFSKAIDFSLYSSIL